MHRPPIPARLSHTASPMPSPIDIDKIALLAALELSAEEKRQFAGQFEAILAYFRKIEEVQLPETLRPGEEEEGPLFRDDVARPGSTPPESFSPHVEDGHFKVPRVIE
ncbi:MAG: aspartyl/glutamyl-tRNA amidotransferase subunit C [Candidatus Lambdaproteobacteria bacterium]|nr:aspartyl/glutamyl-tRNA amidotransferase subunit C [Candidatus Lambdaproteobacteria bacterium]